MHLITPTTSLYIKKSFTLGQKVCSHPFDWNEFENCPELSSSRTRRLRWYCNLAVAVAYYCFILYKCVVVNTSANESVIHKVFMWSVVTLFTIPVAFQATIALNLHSFPAFIRQYTQYVRSIENVNGDRNQVESPRAAKLCELLVVVCYYTFIGETCLWVAGAVLQPHMPHLLPSHESFKSFNGILLSILLWSYFVFSFTANAALVAGTSFPWICASALILQQRRRYVRHKFEAYRRVEILVENFNRTYSIAFTTVIVTLVLFTITGIFGAIRIHGALAMVLAGVAGFDTLLLVLMLEIFANVNSSSIKSVKDIRRDLIKEYGNSKPVGKWHLKRARGLRPIYIRILVVYRIIKVSVLTIARIFADNTIALLMTF